MTIPYTVDPINYYLVAPIDDDAPAPFSATILSNEDAQGLQTHVPAVLDNRGWGGNSRKHPPLAIPKPYCGPTSKYAWVTPCGYYCCGDSGSFGSLIKQQCSRDPEIIYSGNPWETHEYDTSDPENTLLATSH